MARKKNSIDTEVLKKIYRTVSRIRHFEEQGIKLYRQGLIKGYFHPYLGQEGIAAGVCAGSRPATTSRQPTVATGIASRMAPR